MVVQVVLLSLDWAAENYYAIPTHNMGLKYLKYKIDPKKACCMLCMVRMIESFIMRLLHCSWIIRLLEL